EPYSIEESACPKGRHIIYFSSRISKPLPTIKFGCLNRGLGMVTKRSYSVVLLDSARVIKIMPTGIRAMMANLKQEIIHLRRVGDPDPSWSRATDSPMAPDVG
ncbi:4360_t:CDS:2, partial [Acaulospora morrowiae]